jgi:hypothetical protein
LRHNPHAAEQGRERGTEVNMFNWEKGRIPHGITPAQKDEWTFGMIPQGLGKQAFDQVQEKIRDRTLQKVRRDEE